MFFYVFKNQFLGMLKTRVAGMLDLDTCVYIYAQSVHPCGNYLLSIARSVRMDVEYEDARALLLTIMTTRLLFLVFSWPSRKWGNWAAAVAYSTSGRRLLEWANRKLRQGTSRILEIPYSYTRNHSKDFILSKESFYSSFYNEWIRTICGHEIVLQELR